MSESLGDDDDDGRNDGYESSYAHPRGTLSCFHVHPLIAAQDVRPDIALEPHLCRTKLVQKKRRGIATAAQGS